jgi:hypothetical protein
MQAHVSSVGLDTASVAKIFRQKINPAYSRLKTYRYEQYALRIIHQLGLFDIYGFSVRHPSSIAYDLNW